MSRQREAVEGWQLEKDSADAYERYLATAFVPCGERPSSHSSRRSRSRSVSAPRPPSSQSFTAS